MFRKGCWSITLMMASSIFMGGCGLLPEPASLIQAPQMSAAHARELESAAVDYLPKGTAPVVPNAPLGTKPVLMSDFGGDGKHEYVVLHQAVNNTGDVGAFALREEDGKLEKVFAKKGAGYEISWASVNDVTGDGLDELLLGWKIGSMAGNILEVYTWNKNELKMLDKLSYHELELVSFKDQNTSRLALWQKELNDVFGIQLLKWEKGRFNQDKDLYPLYFPKAAKYYQERTEAVPNMAQYWYYLADAHLKANHPGEALAAINQGMQYKIVAPSYSEFEKLKVEIVKELQVEKSSIIYDMREAGIHFEIPSELAANIKIEGGSGPSTNYIVSVYYSGEYQARELLFSIEVYAKEMMPEGVTLEQIAETSHLSYFLRQGEEDEYLKGIDSKYEKALVLKEKMISSVIPGSTEAPYSSLEEKQAVSALQEAIQKYGYVLSGGEREGEEIKSVLINNLDYRYMGKDLDSSSELTEFLAESYTPEAIDSYIKRAGIIEHEGKLAQPNADGGSLLNYQKAQVVAVEGNSTEKEFDLKVPLGSSLSYEYIHIEFQKTPEGWKISSEPGTF
ncbi:DL-endopeptidase inhibitor IseA family protein [Mesobacillus foraminis]|uniref:DL-endopeptidase inhibitor IseA family protein n=1 Tax=Mesobacillus foraminis TaxID=279826 RepID=UPI001BEBCC65|nr:DL-endopeptidase inhibitor IseA family protein [Mesobacillus foraminis]